MSLMSDRITVCQTECWTLENTRKYVSQKTGIIKIIIHVCSLQTIV